MDVTLVAGVNPAQARPSGIRTHVLGLADGISRLGHHVTLIGAGPCGETLPWSYVPLTREATVSSFRFLTALVKRAHRLPVRNAVLHVHRPDDLAPFSLRGDVRARIITLHGLSEEGVRERHGLATAAVYRRFESVGLKMADRILVLDARTRGELEARYPGVTGKVVKGTGGVDLVRFAPRSRQEARERLGIADTPTVAYVGRLAREKNVSGLLQAVAAMPPSVQLVVAGDGPLRGAIEQSGRERSSTRILGTLNPPQVSDLMNAADVLALPSEREALPAVCLEALACGTPVVATRVGGLEDLIVNGRNGYLTQTDTASLTAALGKAIERSGGMRDACRESVKQFGWDAVAHDVVRIYEEAAG